MPRGWTPVKARPAVGDWEDLLSREPPRATRRDVPSRGVGVRPSSSSSTGTTSEGAVLPAGGRERVLHRRRRRRVLKYVEEAWDHRGAGTSLLEQQAVQEQTRRQYRDELRRWLTFSRFEDLNRVSNEAIDESLVRFFERDFFLGEQAHRGAKVLAALMHAEPRFGRRGDRRVPRAWRALKGWRRLAPGRSRRPEPLCFWAGMANEMVKKGESRMALFLLLSVSTYLRPSSMLALGPDSFLAPGGPQGFWSLLAHPAERGVPDKIGEFDHSMLLDSAWLQFISPLLRSLAAQTGQRSVWGFTYWDYLKVFNASAASLGVRAVPYQTRHSGASIDRESRVRTLGEVKQRGGWKADSSVMRYDKHARLRHSELRYPPGLAAHLQTCERQLEAIILQGKVVTRCS